MINHMLSQQKYMPKHIVIDKEKWYQDKILPDITLVYFWFRYWNSKLVITEIKLDLNIFVTV